jgi:ADP-heptose:LPS heptosyltransferase
VKRIAVVRLLGGLGDFLCIIPALRSLRAALPDAKIVFIGLPKTRALVKRFSAYVDEVLAFPGYPGLPEQVPALQKFPAFLTDAQSRQFDLAIQMHGSGIQTNPLTVLLGAKLNAGFFLPNCYCPDPTRFLPYAEHESEIRRYLRLLEFLGIPSKGDELEFPLCPMDEQALSALIETHKLCIGRYVCIHPGASTVERCWRPEYFATVADYITEQGFQVVLTGSPEELPLTRLVAKAMRTESIDLAGGTSLGALAALLKRARLLICNDTGVSHLANALQVPSVVIFNGSDVSRWAPPNRVLHRIVWSETEVRPEDAIVQVNALLSQSNSFAS